MTRIEYLKLLRKGYKDSGAVVPDWITEELGTGPISALFGDLPLAPWQEGMVLKILENPDAKWMWDIPRMTGKRRITDITNS